LIYPLAVLFKIIGAGFLQARLLMVVFIFGFAAVGYSLMRKLYGDAIALAALAVSATFPPLYGNGKSINGEVEGIFFLALSLLCYALTRTQPSRKAFWLIMSGISIGLCVAAKPFFAVVIPALLVGVYIEWRRGVLSPKDILVASVSTVVPIAVWFIAEFRPGDSLGVTLSFYANNADLGDFKSVIIGNMRTLFSNFSTLCTLLFIAVWACAIFLKIRLKAVVTFEEIVAFTFSALLIVAFLFTTGFFRYIFPAQIIALLFCSSSFLFIFHAASKKVAILKGYLAYGAVIAAIAIAGIYQLSFHSYVADNYSNQKDEALQNYFGSLPDSTKIFFLNTPEIVPFFHGNDYYQEVMIFDNSVWGEGSLPIITNGDADLVVIGDHPAKYDIPGLFDKYVKATSFAKYTILQRR